MIPFPFPWSASGCCIVTDSGCHTLQYCMMEHYTSNPLSQLCCPQEMIPQIVRQLSSKDVQRLQQLPSIMRSAGLIVFPLLIFLCLSVCLSLSHSLWLSVCLSLGIILSGNSLSFPWSEKSVGKVPPPTLPFNSYHGWNWNNNLARTTLFQMWAVMHPDTAMLFFSVGADLKNVTGVEQLS